MATTHTERVAERQIRTAEAIMALCEQAGVSRSPSEVRYALAAILGAECSQSTISRLHLALQAEAAGRRDRR